MYKLPGSQGPDISCAEYEARQMQGDSYQQRSSLLDRAFWGVVGAAVARYVYRNWWHPSVRAIVTGFLAYVDRDVRRGLRSAGVLLRSDRR